MLYAKIITNDMLHYGYFEDVDVNPETISIKRFRKRTNEICWVNSRKY